MKDFFDFVVGVLDATAWPLVVFFAYYFFRPELKLFLSRLIAGEMFGAKVKLQSEQEYIASVNRIEVAKDDQERQEIQQNIISPKNETITPEAGAQLLAEEVLKRLGNTFTIHEFNAQFDQFFSSTPAQLESDGVKQFKSMVVEKLRESKRVVEKSENGTLSYIKVSTL